MKASELIKKELPELRNDLLDLLREQFNLRMQKGTGQLTQTHQIRLVRRNIARIRTVIAQKGKMS